MTERDPSLHLSWAELACWNRLGRMFDFVEPGKMIAPYPETLRHRALELATTFEQVRRLLGDRPLTVKSGYRTERYNRAVQGAAFSQHVQGRAIDFTHPTLDAREVYVRIAEAGELKAFQFLGGIGSYPGFVHIDVRPRKGDGRIRRWIY